MRLRELATVGTIDKTFGMTALEAPGPMSIEEYLEIDRKGTERCEYAGGYVYDMGGASEAHNLIATNITVAIHAHLADRPCKVFQNDMKVHVPKERITVVAGRCVCALG